MVFEHHIALPAARNEVNEKQGNTRAGGSSICRQSTPKRLIGKDPLRSAAPRRVGYIRTSTVAQSTDRQIIQLEDHCDILHVEQLSAVAAERPVFEAAIEDLRPGDVFVVVDLDRAFRSSIDAILTADQLRRRSIRFQVLSFPIDTASEEGELFFTILAAFAQFERRIISRRTKEGLEAAKRRGVRLGRPCTLDPETIAEAHDWILETSLPCAYVAALLGVSRLTLQRGFRRLGLLPPGASVYIHRPRKIQQNHRA